MSKIFLTSLDHADDVVRPFGRRNYRFIKVSVQSSPSKSFKDNLPLRVSQDMFSSSFTSLSIQRFKRGKIFTEIFLNCVFFKCYQYSTHMSIQNPNSVQNYFSLSYVASNKQVLTWFLKIENVNVANRFSDLYMI